MNSVKGAFDELTGSIKLHTNNINPFLKNRATPGMINYIITIEKGVFEFFLFFG